MDLETKNKYEANGIKVMVLDQPDPHFRTRTFITMPNGLEYPHYEVFYQVPHLNDGESFSLASTAVHPEDRRDNETILWNDLEVTGQLIGGSTIALATLAIQIVGTIIIFICLYYIINLIFDPHPCGITGSEVEINDCYKKIIFPDCSWKWFNSCGGPDNNGDGFPDGVVEDEGGGDSPIDKIILAIIVGAVAVGGILVISSLLKSRGQAQYAQQFPGYGPPPPSFRESISSRLYRPRKVQPNANGQEYDISAYQ